MAHQLEQIQQAVATIQARTSLTPRVGVILGSGLGGLADELVDATVIRYADIPGFPQSTVYAQVVGELAIGLMGRTPVVVMRGRFQFYGRLRHASSNITRAGNAGTRLYYVGRNQCRWWVACQVGLWVIWYALRIIFSCLVWLGIIPYVRDERSFGRTLPSDARCL
jgi:hypothetical protein